MNQIANQEVLTEFKPERIQRSASFIIHGKIDDVFPLFGPIREKEWAEGWEPEILYCSKDSIVEEHMIFQTKSADEDLKFRWIVTQYQPEKYLIEYSVSTQERVWFIRVSCEDQKETTLVTVSYSYTGLTADGNRKNESALKRMYSSNLMDWQEAINYYLKTGKQLTIQ